MTNKSDAIQYGRVAYSTLDAMREAAEEPFAEDVQRCMAEVQAIMDDIEDES